MNNALPNKISTSSIIATSPPSLGGVLSSLTPSLVNISISLPHQEKLIWFKSCFRPHFEKMIFEPLNRLVFSQDALIGFIFMSCAIDYLSGFLWGESKHGHVRDANINFINKYFSKRGYDEIGLYDSLRNGLVHSFTIKNKKYALIHNNPSIHLTSEKDQIILNAGNFFQDLLSITHEYFDEVENDPVLLDKLIDCLSREGFLVVGPL